jgi:major inositol transporter-like SP family MFS transporter
VVFLAFQQALVSPVTWVLLSEIFPLWLRGIGMGTATFILWVTNACIAFVFPSLVAGFSLSSTFCVFVVLGIVAVTFTFRYVPETSGRSLEAIEEYFRQSEPKESRSA